MLKSALLHGLFLKSRWACLAEERGRPSSVDLHPQQLYIPSTPVNWSIHPKKLRGTHKGMEFRCTVLLYILAEAFLAGASVLHDPEAQSNMLPESKPDIVKQVRESSLLNLPLRKILVHLLTVGFRGCFKEGPLCPFNPIFRILRIWEFLGMVSTKPLCNSISSGVTFNLT